MVFDGLYNDDDDPYYGRECYVFNIVLAPEDDDTVCIHCAKFMTLQCKYIDDFVDEEVD